MPLQTTYRYLARRCIGKVIVKRHMRKYSNLPSSNFYTINSQKCNKISIFCVEKCIKINYESSKIPPTDTRQIFTFRREVELNRANIVSMVIIFLEKD